MKDPHQSSLTPVQCSVSCADGYQLWYRTWTPAGPPRVTVVLLNGVMSHSGWFQPLIEPLLRAGVKVIGADRRGTGLNDKARGDAPSAKVLLDDVKRIVDVERVVDSPVHLAGWCWGAVLAIHAASEHDGLFASLVLLAPGLYPTEALKVRMSQQEEVRISSPPEEPCLESPIREEMFTTGPYLADYIAKDEHRTRRFSPRFYGVMVRMGLGAAVRLQRLRLPMLVVLADEDLATDNAQTICVFDRLKNTSVSIEHLRSAHGMQFDAPKELARLIISWIQMHFQSGEGNDNHAGA